MLRHDEIGILLQYITLRLFGVPGRHALHSMTYELVVRTTAKSTARLTPCLGRGKLHGERHAKPKVATQLRITTPLSRHTTRRLSHQKLVYLAIIVRCCQKTRFFETAMCSYLRMPLVVIPCFTANANVKPTPESAVTVNVRLLYTVQLVKLLASVFCCLASG